MHEFDVLGIGRPYLDILLSIPHMPAADDVLPVNALDEQGGGPVPTAVVTLAKFGASTAIWGYVGDDLSSEFLINDFKHYGVDVRYLQKVPGYRSSMSVILVDQTTGKRAILHHRDLIPNPEPGAVDPAIIARARILHTSGSYLATEVEAARQARQLGVLVSFDGGAGLVRPGIEELVAEADVVVVARRFAEELTGLNALEDCARDLFKRGPRTVVITDGEQGSWGWAAADTAYHQPAFRVKVRDTTGAGDVYHGAFLYGLLQHWPLSETLRFAAAVAAMKCTRLGGRAGIPTLAEVQHFLTSH